MNAYIELFYFQILKLQIYMYVNTFSELQKNYVYSKTSITTRQDFNCQSLVVVSTLTKKKKKSEAGLALQDAPKEGVTEPNVRWNSNFIQTEK